MQSLAHVFLCTTDGLRVRVDDIVAYGPAKTAQAGAIGTIVYTRDNPVPLRTAATVEEFEAAWAECNAARAALNADLWPAAPVKVPAPQVYQIVRRPLGPLAGAVEVLCEAKKSGKLYWAPLDDAPVREIIRERSLVNAKTLAESGQYADGWEISIEPVKP